MRINCRKRSWPVGFRGEGDAAWAWCPYNNQKVTYERCKECKFFMGEAEDIRDVLPRKKDERWAKTVKASVGDAIRKKDEEIAWLKEEIERMKEGDKK